MHGVVHAGPALMLLSIIASRLSPLPGQAPGSAHEFTIVERISAPAGSLSKTTGSDVPRVMDAHPAMMIAAPNAATAPQCIAPPTHLYLTAKGRLGATRCKRRFPRTGKPGAGDGCLAEALEAFKRVWKGRIAALRRFKACCKKDLKLIRVSRSYKGVQTVIQTPGFLSDAKAAGLSDDEREAMIAEIAADPMAGDIMEGTGGCRTVHYFGGDDIPVVALALIDKGDSENLSKAERNELRREMAGYVDDYRKGAAEKAALLKR